MEDGRLHARNCERVRSCVYVAGIWLIMIGGSFVQTTMAELTTRDEANVVADNSLTQTIDQQNLWIGATPPGIFSDDLLLGNVNHNSPQGFLAVQVAREFGPIKAYSDEPHIDVGGSFNTQSRDAYVKEKT